MLITRIMTWDVYQTTSIDNGWFKGFHHCAQVAFRSPKVEIQTFKSREPVRTNDPTYLAPFNQIILDGSFLVQPFLSLESLELPTKWIISLSKQGWMNAPRQTAVDSLDDLITMSFSFSQWVRNLATDPQGLPSSFATGFPAWIVRQQRHSPRSLFAAPDCCCRQGASSFLMWSASFA